MDLRIPSTRDVRAKSPVPRREGKSSTAEDAPAGDDGERSAESSPTPQASVFEKLGGTPQMIKQVQAFLDGRISLAGIAEAAPPTVKVRFLPQDDLLPDRVIEVPRKEVGSDLTGTRVKTAEDPTQFRPPTADKDGNYIFKIDDPRTGAVNAHVSACKALQIASKYLGRDVKWAFKRESDRDRLWIHPHAGQGLNAFYNNKNGSLNFLYDEDPRTKELVDTSTSLEVVAHETGHAILDGLRPNYLDALDTSTEAFHEAFGDCMSMLASLHDDDVVEALYQQTQGDLSQPNILSCMGEKLGRAMRGPKKPYVRNALNDHTYRDPHFLPFLAFPDGPALEPHSRSQVWTASNYDLLHILVNEQMEDSKTPFVDAIKSARDTYGSLILRAVEFAPPGKISFKDAAAAMVKADVVDHDGAHVKPLIAVFSARGILTQDDANEMMQDMDATNMLSGVLSLPPDFKAADAGEFLKKNADLLAISENEAKDLKFGGLVTNDRGERLLTWNQSRKVELPEPEWGAEFQGSTATVNGGLLLAFDKEGKLTVVTRDPITDDNIHDTKLFMRKMIDFEKNPPIIVKKGESDADDADAKSDPHLDYLLASTRQPLQVVNGEVRRSGIIY